MKKEDLLGSPSKLVIPRLSLTAKAVLLVESLVAGLMIVEVVSRVTVSRV